MRFNTANSHPFDLAPQFQSRVQSRVFTKSAII
jgi:hypothetical protein